MVAITTQLSPNPASGNTTADGTAQTLASSAGLSSGGIFVLIVETVNMAAGDVLELRLYTSVNTANDRQCAFASFSNAQSDVATLAMPVPVEAGGRFKATLKQAAGTNRSYQWKIVQL